MWWILPTICLAGILEVVGWSGRIWSSMNISNISPFQMQCVPSPSYRSKITIPLPFPNRITATILGPTPLLAANFVILGRIINMLGPQFSRLSPKWCTCYSTWFVIVMFIFYRHNYFLHLRTWTMPALCPIISGTDVLCILKQDVVSLVIQGVGGGVASSAADGTGDARLVRVHCPASQSPTGSYK